MNHIAYLALWVIASIWLVSGVVLTGLFIAAGRDDPRFVADDPWDRLENEAELAAKRAPIAEKHAAGHLADVLPLHRQALPVA